MTEEHDASRIWSHVLTWGLLTLFASGVLVKTVPLTSHRPPESSPASLAPTGRQDVEARLWDDPFIVMRDLSAKTAVERCKLALADPPHHPATLTNSIRRLSSRGATVSVMAAMVPTGPYFEDAETRRRNRYAVVQGLMQSGWYPFEGDKLGFVWTLESCIENPWQRRAPEIVPYEWFCKDGSCANSQALLVLWTDEDALARRPLEGMETLIARISDPTATCPVPDPLSAPGAVFLDRNRAIREMAASDQASTSAVAARFCASALAKGVEQPSSRNRLDGCRVRCSYQGPPWARTVVLGPMQSQTLAALARDLGDERPRSSSPFADWLRFYSSGATAADRDVGLVGSPSEKRDQVRTPLDTKAEHDRRLVRLTTTDNKLVEALLEELRLRLVSPWAYWTGPGQKGRPGTRGGVEDGTRRLCNGILALVIEADTSYARHFPAKVRDTLGCEGDQNPLREIRYLRGLDGAAPRGREDEEPAVKRRDDRGAVFTAEALFRASPPERSEGPRQFDYLTRLAEELESVHVENKASGGEGVVAVGILGSDVYDKLVVLEAVKPHLPDAVFFTTDLDARLVDASRERRAARNLVVASGYGLQLAPELQGATPPFRDTYQTGLYLATRLALEQTRGGADTPPMMVDPRIFDEPALFEIGRTKAVALGGCPTRPLCKSLHDLQRRGSPREGSGNDGRVQQGDAPGRSPLTGPLQTASVAVPASVSTAFDPFFERLKGSTCPSQPSSEICSLRAQETIIESPLSTVGSYWLQALGATVTAVALILLASRRARDWVRLTPRRVSLLRVAGVLVVLALAGAGAVFLAVDARSRAGEPFLWAEGVSVWPTQIIRVFSLGVIVLLLWFGRLRLEARLQGIAEDFREDAAPRSPRWTVAWLWWSPSSEDDSWNQYRARMTRPASLARVFVSSSLFAVFAFCVVAFDWPNSPHRGSFSAAMNHALFATMVVCLSFLLFAALDAQAMTRRLLQRLTNDDAVKLPEPAVDEIAEEYPVARRFRDRLARFRLGVKVATAVSGFMWLPFLVLPLVFVARSTVFDAWDFPLSYIALLILVTVLAIGGALRLRAAANNMRERLLRDLRRAIDEREDRSFSTIYRRDLAQRPSAASLEVSHLEAEHLRRMQAEVRDTRTGPFRPFSQEPAVRAVLAFLGTGGLTAIVEALIA